MIRLWERQWKTSHCVPNCLVPKLKQCSCCQRNVCTATILMILFMEIYCSLVKNHQNSETKGISNLYMPQVNGTLKDEILKCVQNKQLCEWHVSLAPSISYKYVELFIFALIHGYSFFV